jgi:polar amino acid transport system permease protein
LREAVLAVAEAETRDTRPEIVRQISEAQHRSRLLFRGRFALIWLVMVGSLVGALWVTGNIDPAFIGEWGPFILNGAWTTIQLCVASIFLATILAVLGAMARLSNNVVAYSTASLYVSLVRGTPLLVQIFFMFYALPQVGIVLPAVPAGIIALSFNYGAYMTEIFRAGIQAVPPGQREAAQALGMPEHLIMRRIVLPQAVRIVIPAIGNEFIAMIKDSALVSTIAVQELLWRARRVGTQNFRTLEALLIAALVYWLLTIVFSFFQERLERRLARSDR